MLAQLREAIASYNQSDRDLIARAFEFAKKAHEGQIRLSGEPFIDHCQKVALKLAQLNLDVTTIAAALLHDVAEDTPYDLESIRRHFGAEIAKLVDGLTKLDKVRLTKRWVLFGPTTSSELSQFDRYAETLRKMFLATAKDLRVIIIKLADRLHNMETIGALPPDRRKRNAIETLEVYAPIAYRLGMNEIKGQLEDLAFPHAFPKDFARVRKLAGPTYDQCAAIAEEMRKRIHELLRNEHIKHDIHARSKHRYSLWRKLQRYHNDFSKIYDLVAVRVFVDDVETCYRVLDAIHKRFPPIAYRIKDYIAHPKPNGYQSLHTTVAGPNNQIVEIQIRTHHMHEQAEYGVASHWMYKATAEGRLQHLRRRFRQHPKEAAWVKQLAAVGKQLKDPKELESQLKVEFFGDRIFAITPKGDVKDLPAGATALDFAYAVHSEIGNHAMGAKVNGKMTKLSTVLQNGDHMEILTSRNARPSPDWIDIVKTHHARSHIRHALRLRGLIPAVLRRK